MGTKFQYNFVPHESVGQAPISTRLPIASLDQFRWISQIPKLLSPAKKNTPAGGAMWTLDSQQSTWVNQSYVRISYKLEARFFQLQVVRKSFLKLSSGRTSPGRRAFKPWNGQKPMVKTSVFFVVWKVFVFEQKTFVSVGIKMSMNTNVFAFLRRLRLILMSFFLHH